MIFYKTTRLAIFSLVIFCVALSYAQVGINTTAPNGILDINSSTNGVVFPRVSLTATNVAAPIVNPNGGALAPGTTVFNTNVTTTGANDVSVGMYSWDGSQWVAQFDKRQSQLYTQDRSTGGGNTSNDFIGFRTRANGLGGAPPFGGSPAVFESIYGLDNQTFIAEYTGTYRITVSTSYGAGQIRRPSTNEDESFVAGQGMFRFTFDGTNHDHYVNSVSGFNSTGGTPNNYFAIGNQFTKIIHVDLTAGQSYNFNLAFDQWGDAKLLANGESGNGRGVVGILTASTIDITLVD